MITKHHYIDLRCLLDLVTPALKMLGVTVNVEKHRRRVIDNYGWVRKHALHDFMFTYLPYIIQESKVNFDVKEFIDYTLLHTANITLEESERVENIYHVNKLSLSDDGAKLYETMLRELFGIKIILDNSHPIHDFDRFTTFIVYNGLDIINHLSVNGEFVNNDVSEKLMLTPLFITEVHKNGDIKLLMEELRMISKTIVQLEFMPIETITTKENTTADTI